VTTIPRYTAARVLLSLAMMAGWIATMYGCIGMFSDHRYGTAIPNPLIMLQFILCGPLVFILWSLCMAVFDGVALLAEIKQHQVTAAGPPPQDPQGQAPAHASGSDDR
jgi:hypothetical protein